MKNALIIIMAAALFAYPFKAPADDYGAMQPQNGAYPPVSQDLVREGDFAINLAAKLDLGTPEDEGSAETLLSEAGIMPLNGWLSDYPVTPEIVGQLQSSISKASDDGKLSISGEEATRRMYALAAEQRLPVPAGSGGAPNTGRQPMPSNPTVVNNYYYDQGPPVVTYYPPPADYAYLYAWVPYPAWWFGFWFPGFYICHTFTTVVVTQPLFIGGAGRRGIVTNLLIDPVTRTRIVVSPVVRTRDGRISPTTTISTGNGYQYRTLSELRQRVSIADRHGVGGQTFESTRNRGTAGPGATDHNGRYRAPRMSAAPYIAPRLGVGRDSSGFSSTPLEGTRTYTNRRQGNDGVDRFFRGGSDYSVRGDNGRAFTNERGNSQGRESRSFTLPDARRGVESRGTAGDNVWQRRTRQGEMPGAQRGIQCFGRC